MAGVHEAVCRPAPPLTPKACSTSVPRLDQERSGILNAIPGNPPNFCWRLPSGCPVLAALFVCVRSLQGAAGLSLKWKKAASSAVTWTSCRRNRRWRVEPSAGTGSFVIWRFISGSTPGDCSATTITPSARSTRSVSTCCRPKHWGLSGESGCGKSTLARAILGLVRPKAGSVTWLGEDLVGLSEEQMRAKRREIQLIFQDPSGLAGPAHDRRRYRCRTAQDLLPVDVATADSRSEYRG